MTVWSLLDLGTRWWWRAWGRPVDLRGADAWLDAPTHGEGVVGDEWLTAAAEHSGTRLVEDEDGGLLRSMSDLDADGFRHDLVHPLVRDFYEHTATWRMEVWTGWNPLFRPGGALIARWFGRRVGQLAIPVDPLSVSRGMDSRIVTFVDAEDRPRGAAWIRTLRSTGEYVYSGRYAVTTVPSTGRPAVHVTFPLEAGNVQVFLAPENDADGSLWLRSPQSPHGGLGAYVVVRVRGRDHAAHPPLAETFHVFVDEEEVLRTDHELRLWGMRVVRLHYRLEKRS
jgi:hypothetical protein